MHLSFDGPDSSLRSLLFSFDSSPTFQSMENTLGLFLFVRIRPVP